MEFSQAKIQSFSIAILEILPVQNFPRPGKWHCQSPYLSKTLTNPGMFAYEGRELNFLRVCVYVLCAWPRLQIGDRSILWV